MRVVITGAAGFVASGVADAIAADPSCLGAPVTDLVLADVKQGSSAGRWITGDLSDPAHVEDLLAEPVDVFFHLASIPGGMAETNPDLGRAVNLTASLGLTDGLAQQARAGGPVARLVFSSTIAVFGPFGTETVDETHLVAPSISYGAHKLMTEIEIADLSRRGDIDGISVRLPGIVARPPAATGFGSAFLSDLFHKARASEPYVCPVSREATTWWMSRETVIRNILHAARMDTSQLSSDRMVLLPPLYASIGDLIDGLGQVHGAAAVATISHSPNEGIETLFGRHPRVDNSRALALGFHTDTDVASLIANVEAQHASSVPA